MCVQRSFHVLTILDLHKYQNGNARLSVLVLQHGVKWWQVQMWCQCLLKMQQYSGIFRNTGRTDVMPVFAAAIFRVMTMCCHYLEYCWMQVKNTGTTCTEYQQSTKYKNGKLSSFGARGSRTNCKLSKLSISYCSKYWWEFAFNIAAVKYCWAFFFHIAVVKYCLFHLSWCLATSLLSYYFCVFWQMQLLRFSYFSKFKYYIDVLKYS